MILRAQLEILLRHPEIFVTNEYDINPVLDYRRMKVNTSVLLSFTKHALPSTD
jgi:hypothetical protein